MTTPWAPVFDALFESCAGLVELRALPSERRGFFAPTETDAIAAFLAEHQAQDLYFGVATRRDRAEKREAREAARARGRKAMRLVRGPTRLPDEPVLRRDRMSLVKIDDGFADHPKILRAGPRAVVAQLRALCYCARYLTDGHLSPAAASACVAGLRLKARDMVRAKLWDTNGAGYVVHDFLKYNPSAAEVAARRAKRARAGKLGHLALVQNPEWRAAHHRAMLAWGARRLLSLDEILARHVEMEPMSGCWLWVGEKNHGDYGVFRREGAHRFIFKALGGVILPGFHLDHLCRVRCCVNPAHLEPVLPAENGRRAHERVSWTDDADARNPRRRETAVTTLVASDTRSAVDVLLDSLVHDPSSGWVCACGATNDEGDRVCELCGTERTSDVALVEAPV